MLRALRKPINRLPSHRAVIFTMLLLGGLAMLPRPATASELIQTFGPGKVSCQPLVGKQMDCLLSANRISDNRSVASFDLGLLPRRDQALFR